MINKQNFYHGVALISLLDDENCEHVQKYESGYLVNNRSIFFLKYSTKNRSPWRFVFNNDEIGKFREYFGLCGDMFMAFICGGDGVCVIHWKELESIMDDNAKWISAKRNYNKRFTVAGSKGVLDRKVSLRDWPSVLFEVKEDGEISHD